jgi:hypothetical protein
MSISKKEIGKLYNQELNFSSTSSNFFSEINFNQFGGSCDCSEVIDAFKKNDFKNALYLIKNNKCCFKCKDDSGNTILHLAILNCNNDSIICNEIIDHILDNDCTEFIDSQNDKGETPILLSVKNGILDVSEKLDNKGANLLIKDNEGNAVRTDNIINETESLNITNTMDSNQIKKDTVETENSTLHLTDRSKQIGANNKVLQNDLNKESIDLVDMFKKNLSAESSINNSNLSEIENTDHLIHKIREKYSSSVKTDITSSINNINENSITVKQLINEPTSELNGSNIHNTDTSIGTNELLNKINSIDNSEYSVGSVNLSGGYNSHTIVGKRKLLIDSEIIYSDGGSNSLGGNISYDDLYNTDNEGITTNRDKSQLSRMMISQKETIHQQVLDMIMAMLNKGLLVQNNKPLEANEKNAKLVKAYVYRHISEENPSMGGMDKITIFQAMKESDIIKLVKKMPDIDELEKSIQKHLMEKKQNKNLSKNEQNVDSTLSETEQSNKSKKSTKSKKIDDTDKSSKSKKNDKPKKSKK